MRDIPGSGLRGWTVILFLALVAAAPAVAGPTESVSDLRSELAAALKAAPGSPRYSVLAVSLDTGDTLFARGADTPLAPASNMKLLTTATALRELGPDYRYPTYLLAKGPVENGVLRGDLVLYGTGDPGISDRIQDSRTAVFEAFADSLAAMGIHTVTGDVVGDGTFFAGPLRGEGWDPRDLNDWFAAPTNGLAYQENMVTLRVAPTRPGQPPEIHTLPEGAVINLRNEARTVAGGVSRRNRIQITRDSPDQPIVIKGQIPRGGREVWRQMSVSDPGRYAASVLLTVLEERGIQVAGTPRSVPDAATSAVTGRRLWAPALKGDAAPLRLLATHVSPPLEDYLAITNKKSHNFFADLTLKTLGRVEEGDGSFAAGASVVKSFLAGSAQVDTTHIVMLDGSGLSGMDRVSAADFVRLLRTMARSDLWDEYWATLPEAGNPHELRRMYRSAAAGNLRAKTGTIEHVSALSGLVRSETGERILFSIVANDVPSTWGAKRVEDRIGMRLASFDRPFEAAPTPEPTRMASASNDTTGAAVTAAAEQAEVPETPAQEQVHRVRSGENLTVIAHHYGVSLNELLDANEGIDPNRLQVGQRVTIPTAAQGGS